MDKKDILAARTTMANWKDYRGGRPFGCSDSRSVEDRAAPILAQANSMLSMLAAACDDAQQIVGQGGSSAFDERNVGLLAGALEGVSTLIELASFMLED